MNIRLALIVLILSNVACSTSQPMPDGVVWVENDKNPIEKPAEYWSGLYWDGADKMVFRPLSHFWLFEVKGPAKNVNVLQEVPNSSWYTNRMALKTLDPKVAARGACDETPINTKGPLIVKGGKVDGANPGFRVKDPSTGENYLLKFDGRSNQKFRATAADTIGSKIYWAAGFETPCNEVIYFDPKILEIDEDATKKDDVGKKTKMTQADIDAAIGDVPADGRGLIRASASLFITGEPIDRSPTKGPGPMILTISFLTKTDEN